MLNKEITTESKFCESCRKDLPLERFKRDFNRKAHHKIKENVCCWCWRRMIKNHGPVDFYGRRKVKEYTPEEIEKYQKSLEKKEPVKAKPSAYEDL